ncbi:putative enoyl-CoA hydratase/isomerase [Rhizocola hellebori]|uniref:Putative enoyl-CoA hydratase/isomerase n=1 Tax=Rhizocola hellebori TaxID=1392758 RepID=A0A8J3QA99_9ACTN|nr:crotonase/enoyl-CoA hydratase family protein [Rhizocola hellebori]GIH06304.1 putative enoyl-CoA hydratase/isomerase [Rhizocola hellebori]
MTSTHVETAVVGTAVTGTTLVITINRPHARNAIDRAVAEQISAAVDRLERESDLAVGILTGAGSTFCSGMDLKAFATQGFPFIGERGLAGITRVQRTKPLIAAVEGYAVAGGCELALACDLIVASGTAVFGLPEVTRGLVASEGGAIRLPKRLPYHVAMHMLLTGDTLDAAAAARLGLVSQLAAPGEALTDAIDLAARIAHNAPLAVAATLRIAALNDSDAFTVQDRIAAPVAASQDAREGAQAFAEKRPPRWQGH